MRFPESISEGAIGGPGWSNEKIVVKSGKTKTIKNWDQPLYRFEVSHNVKTQEQMDELERFFNVHGGNADPFRFKWWKDYIITKEKSYVLRPSTDKLELYKGDVDYSKRITKIVDRTFKLYADDVLVEIGYDLDIETGIVTLSTPEDFSQNTNFTFESEYDLWVCFENPEMQYSIDMYGIYSWNSIRLVEDRG